MMMTPLPPPDAPTPSLTPAQRRGRALLLTVFIVFTLLDVALIVVNATEKGLADTVPSCVRVCLSIALMYAIWIGQRWARWLYVVLIYIAGALMLLASIVYPNVVSIVLLLVCAVAGSLVGFYRDIGSFLQFQRENRGKRCTPSSG